MANAKRFRSLLKRVVPDAAVIIIVIYLGIRGELGKSEKEGLLELLPPIAILLGAMALGEVFRAWDHADDEGRSEEISSSVKRIERRLNLGALKGGPTTDGDYVSLTDSWHSRYLYPYDAKPGLLPEIVKIQSVAGAVFIESVNNPKNDQYCATGFQIERRHIVGDWRSTRPGANAFGCFMLNVSSMGDTLYGIYAGETESGPIHGEWVLVRTSVPDLENAFASGFRQLHSSCRNLLKATPASQ